MYLVLLWIQNTARCILGKGLLSSSALFSSLLPMLDYGSDVYPVRAYVTCSSLDQGINTLYVA